VAFYVIQFLLFSKEKKKISTKRKIIFCLDFNDFPQIQKKKLFCFNKNCSDFVFCKQAE
jgi:hypothetical protein